MVGQFAATGTSLLGSKAYDPWGSVTTATGTVTGLLGYQSGWSDAAAGKTLMGSRWYNSSAGDFTSADTMQVSPAPDSAAGNPFAYAGDDPLDYTDPTGHFQKSETAVAIPVAVACAAFIEVCAAVAVGGAAGLGIGVGIAALLPSSHPAAATLNPDVSLLYSQPTFITSATATVPASKPANAKAAPAPVKSSNSSSSSSSSSSNSQAAEAKAKAAAAAKAKAAAAAAAAKAKAAAAAKAKAAAEAAARAAAAAAAAGQAAQARAAAGNAAAAAAAAAGAAAASGDGSVSDGSGNGARAGGSPGYGTTGETAPETAAAGGSSIGNGGGTPPTINGGDDLGPRPGGDEEPGDDGSFTKVYPGGSTVLADVDGNGAMTMAIQAEEGSVRGGQMFRDAMEGVGPENVRSFEAKWIRAMSSNLDAFNANLRAGMSYEEAATNTFTGHMLAKYGLTEVVVDPSKLVGEFGNYTNVEPIFSRPAG